MRLTLDILPAAILDIGAEGQTLNMLEILSDGRSLVLTPIRSNAEARKFDEAVAMVHKRFGKAMKRLAE